jgi:hypothetical protein
MAGKREVDRIGELIGEVEALAKRLGREVRKRARAAGIPRDLQGMAARLRKRAASVAAQVEKYAHRLRLELEAGAKAGKRARPKKRRSAAAA